jgi:hypothetical protein
MQRKKFKVIRTWYTEGKSVQDAIDKTDNRNHDEIVVLMSIDRKKARFWSHGPHCNCGYCRPMEGNEKYIIYDNGGDFGKIELPKKIGDAVLLEDQLGEHYTLTKAQK